MDVAFCRIDNMQLTVYSSQSVQVVLYTLAQKMCYRINIFVPAALLKKYVLAEK